MNIRPYLNHTPTLSTDCYIDESAIIIGQVSLGKQVSVWPKTVIRGDVNYIQIGDRSNIQDGCILHVTRNNKTQTKGAPLIIGEDVTIGHGVILHGCKIGHRVLVGMGSIILDNAVIENDIIIGAGSLVPPQKTLQAGYLYMGSPVKIIRELTTQEKEELKQSAMNYVSLSKNYL